MALNTEELDEMTGGNPYGHPSSEGSEPHVSSGKPNPAVERKRFRSHQLLAVSDRVVPEDEPDAGKVGAAEKRSRRNNVRSHRSPEPA